MDEINNFFKSNAPTEQLSGSQSGGYRIISSYASSSSCQKKEKLHIGQEYAQKIQEDERQQMLDLQTFDYDEDDECKKNSEFARNTPIVLRKYNFNRSKTKLPIEDYKSRILGLIASQTVTIIEGPTGCGKTTQIPQWILKECYDAQQHCNIIVTQPRRIAAMCIADRVACEHSCQVGELIGYRVGLEKKLSEDTRLQYVTTGVLLNEIISKQSLRNYTHIILDEVHERDQEMDFLLIVIRKLLRNNSHNVKVILMSATFNVVAFADYFAMSVSDAFESVPVLTVRHRDNIKPHIVQIFYLDHLSKLRVPAFEGNKAEITDEMFELTVKLLNAFETIDLREEDTAQDEQRPCVLIFLPGLSTIEYLYCLLNSEARRMKIDDKSPMHKWWLVPLHSTITVFEQNKAFQKPPNGYRKILLATNIAESSITVPDVKYVIDFCLTKINVVKPGSQFPMLQLNWTSKASCIQRAGRAGRVKPGKVYRLVPKCFYENFAEENVPEIQRSNIETLILSAKMLKMGSPKNILALAMNPPDLSNIHKNILLLKTMGALYKTVNNVDSNEDGDITFLGEIMSKLPLDLRVSKLIVLGYIFGCVEEAIIIGAAISTKNIFKAPFLKLLATYNSKVSWAQGSMSDCIAFLHVYAVYKSLDKGRNFTARSGGFNDWADNFFLQQNSVRDWVKLVNEIKMRLHSVDIQINQQKSKIWSKVELTLVLKIIMAGAFYPNYFLMSNRYEDDREAAKELNGWNPFNSVYFTNMDNRQPGELYVSQLMKMLENNGCTAKNMQFDFDKNSSKIILSFPSIGIDESDSVMGKVSLPIYQVIKMRMSKVPMILNVLPLQEALHRASELGISTDAHLSKKLEMSSLDKNMYIVPCLPGIDESYVILRLLRSDMTGLFWAQYADESSLQELKRINNKLNAPYAELVILNYPPAIGELYAAYDNNTPQQQFYRVVVESLVDCDKAMVSFIDMGKVKMVRIDNLRLLGPSLYDLRMIKPAAFQFVLSELTPSIIKDIRGFWSTDALNKIRELTEGKRLKGKVFSVVFSIISLELFNGSVNINELLVREGFAQTSEESYLSKVNRDLRRRVDTMQPVEIHVHNNEQILKNVQRVSRHMAPDERYCTQRISLKGPFSPLETTVTGLFNIGANKAIDIDRSSVNSVLLNTDSNAAARMLIAASISESESGSRYTIRNTTIMPNLPGIASILALIFSPTAQLVTDEHHSCFVSTLCGLGHINGKALFPEYDIVVDTNVEITNEDLENINLLRKTISIALSNMETGYFDEDTKLHTSNKIKILVNKLLSVQRKNHNFEPTRNVWSWNSMDNYEAFEVEDVSNYILPPISGIKLKPRNRNIIEKLVLENKKLHALSNISSFQDNNMILNCTLCGTGMLTMHNLSMHLHSRMHIEQELSLSKN